jgi:hypothetical protein
MACRRQHTITSGEYIMALILDGTNGLSDVDGTAATPAIRGTDTNTGIFFPAADTIAFSEGGVESMRIGSTGNIGIGATDNANIRLLVKQAVDSDVGGIGFQSVDGASTAVISELNSGALVTRNSGAERMRIDISGNLLVGGTSSDARFVATSGANAPAGRFYSTITSGFSSESFQVICAQSSGTTFNVAAFYVNNATQYAAYIRGDGTIFAVNPTVQAVSDSRFKENIVNSTDGLNIVEALRPVRFDFKEGNGVTAKANQLGFIAQEVKAVFPEAVDVWGESDDPENPYLSLGTSALIPVLVKAIQELKATVDAQAARIAALEAAE